MVELRLANILRWYGVSHLLDHIDFEWCTFEDLRQHVNIFDANAIILDIRAYGMMSDKCDYATMDSVPAEEGELFLRRKLERFLDLEEIDALIEKGLTVKNCAVSSSILGLAGCTRECQNVALATHLGSVYAKMITRSRVLHITRRIAERDPTLTKVDLRHSHLKNIDFMRNAEFITHLDITGNRVRSLEPLRRNKSLVTLRASANHIESIDPLKDNTSLKSVSLSENRIGSIEALRHNRTIECLFLGENPMTSVEPLFRNQVLEVCTIRGNNQIPSETIELIEKMTEFNFLNSGNRKMSLFKMITTNPKKKIVFGYPPLSYQRQ